jgi:hypothetical protein
VTARRVIIIKVLRGKSGPRKRTLAAGEWAWLLDTHELVTGDGVTPGYIRGQYKGGLLTIFGRFQAQIREGGDDIWLAWPALPLSVPDEIRQRTVFDEGEIIYCPEENWLYVGDGVTAGGWRAK